jgi:catechol 2,3-dioxygenase-like lactoylglutathione lyase family enzyme
MVSEYARLHHLFTTVADLASARAFWTEVIGLGVVVEDDEYVRVSGEGGFTMGIERAADGTAPEVEIVVRVADVDAVYQRLASIGVECDAPPRDMPWGGRHIWLRDPDGRPISIFSAQDPDAK